MGNKGLEVYHEFITEMIKQFEEIGFKHLPQEENCGRCFGYSNEDV